MKTGHDVIEKTASACWNRAHPDEDCPEDKIPGQGELVAWAASRQPPQVPPCPPEALAKASELLAALYPHCHDEGGAWHWVEYLEDPPEEDPPEPPAECKPARSLDAEIIPEEIIPRPHVEESLLAVFPFREGKRRYGDLAAWWTTPRTTFLATLPEMAATYKALPLDERQSFPLSPIVQAWQARPLPVEPYRPKNRASLARFDKAKTDPEERRLLEIRQPVPVASGGQLQLDLPELTPATTGRSWLLDLFDRAGGQSMRQGRGAPWEMRLFVGGILNLGIVQRDGEFHRLRFDTDEVIAWLHPNGWPNRASDWAQFPAALFRLNKQLGFVAIDGLGYVQIIGATIIPKKPDDPQVEFIVRIPKTAAHGARIDWPTLCQYGQRSAALYRAYLSSVECMHLSAHNGQPITQAIGKPLLGKDDKPLRAKGGKVRHSRTEQIANPSTCYVRGLTEGELTEMIGLDPTNRQRRHDARRAFERLEADGVIDLEKDGKVWRIFGPYPNSS